MITVDCEQGSDEWVRARLGIPTASEFSKIYTATGKVSASAEVYMYELIGERLTGKPADDYCGKWMQYGKEMESQARETYNFINNIETQTIGFCYMSKNKKVGASPDGLIGTNGVLEIKCPKTSTHIKYMLNGVVPPAYVPQVQGLLMVTGREWCDFMSYDPNCDPLIIRVMRDEKWIKTLSDYIIVLNQRIDEATMKLRRAA